mgnify:CR=1 FL=1
MKKLLLGAVSLIALGLVTPASAADLAARPYTKAPPPAPLPLTWAGFYAGINGGGGWSRNCWNLTGFTSTLGTATLGDEGCHTASGGTVGGQIGYRWQVNQAVFGLEAQGNWADISGSSVSSIFAPDSNRTRIDAFGLFTGQIGYAMDSVLLYAKGGAAITNNKHQIIDGVTGDVLASTTKTRWGGTVGAGIEYSFAPNWSLGFEYDHLFMGRQDVTLTGTTFVQTDSIKQDVDLFTARINYKFGGPLVARY